MSEKNETLLRVRKTLGDTIQAHGNNTWNVSPEVGLWLRDTVIERKAVNILEVGTSIGYSALFLAEAARRTNGHVTTIESHENRGSEATKVFNDADVGDVVTLIKGHAPEIFSPLSETWDFIFFDATKYEHRSYVEALLPKLEKKVCIIADNCTSHAEAMAPYIAYMNTLPNFQHKLIQKGSGLFVSTRE